MRSARISSDRVIRRLFVRTIVLFLALFAGDLAIVGWLFARDFNQRALQQKLLDTQIRGGLLAERLTQELAPAGSLDFVRIVERRAVLAKVIGEYTAQLKVVQFVDVLAPDGRPILRQRRDVNDAGEVHIEGRSFGGLVPQNPDSPPPFPVLLAKGQRLAILGPTAERIVPVPMAGGIGTVLLGLSGNSIEEESARLWREMMFKLVVGAAISLVLLAVAFFYVLRVIQRTRRLEAEAQRAEQLAYLGTLASGLAHEIRNPLNAMNINLQMLEEELADGRIDQDTLALLRGSRAEVLRLERLVRDFLAYARPQPSSREEVAPAELVGDVVRFMRPQFQGAGVTLQFDADQPAPHVSVDAGQIRQALLNILQNALEASAPKHTVRVSVGATEQGEARIEVADEGPGIPQDFRERIFEVFWSRKAAGSGLGLPIALRVVESHGGRIEVESEAGRGSTFRIVLPNAMASGSEASPAPLPATHGPV
ncbi:MAG: hypothetical protein KBD01_00665 [Acidobacteria bacterium]|nr:hypothetical protein [Acidobacteriota bacterium]